MGGSSLIWPTALTGKEPRSILFAHEFVYGLGCKVPEGERRFKWQKSTTRSWSGQVLVV